MGRRKGSLNKTTIEKMSRQRFSLGNPIQSHLNAPQRSFQLKADKVTVPENLSARERLTSKNDDDFWDSWEDEDSIPEDSDSSDEQSEEEKDIPAVKEKNPSPEQEETPPPEEGKIPLKSPRRKTGYLCDRCGKIIKFEPYKIDTNLLTGRAGYFRNAPRFVKLCGECSEELSKIIDDWLISGGCKDKFAVRKEENCSTMDERNFQAETENK